MCVCCLTAALIRPLWVRLIGPVIRDAALPPSLARWITSHCRLLRFQDKWTEGESITRREGEREVERDIEGGTEYHTERLRRIQKLEGRIKRRKWERQAGKKRQEKVNRTEGESASWKRMKKGGMTEAAVEACCYVSPLPSPQSPSQVRC